MSLPIIAVRWIEWIDKKQPQILHCVQDDSALESRNACRFGIVRGLWATRKYRGFWDAKSKRRSFTAFRMTALWNAAQDDSASEVWWQLQHNLLVRHRFDLFWKSATPCTISLPASHLLPPPSSRRSSRRSEPGWKSGAARSHHRKLGHSALLQPAVSPPFPARPE